MNNLIHRIAQFSRFEKQLIMVVFDSFLILSTLLLSFSIRLGYWFWPKGELHLIILISPFIAIPIFYSFKLYHSVIRYIGVKALFSIFQAVSLYALAWGILGYMLANESNVLQGIPRSVIIINWMLIFIVLGASRLMARHIFSDDSIINMKKKTNVLIYGAGSSGRELSHSLQLSKEYNHIGFIDDNSLEHGNFINNIKIYPFEKVQLLIQNKNVNEILLALPSISRKRRKQIIDKLGHFSIKVRSLPSLSALAEGKVKVDDLLEVDVADLLGRKSVATDKNLLKVNIFKKNVLVTGAGGSIGSELCRQIISLKPNKLILYEISESSLYLIEQELIKINLKSIEIFPVLGSISDKKRFELMCHKYNIQKIFHAAAYKHVPLVEFNPSQGILNNAIGTMIAAKVAINCNIETFVLISTDKAVRPTSVMGATKRIAELILQALSKTTNNTCFTMVRFGNVLESSGSVIPLFKQQIMDGGPVTVTHPNIIRYFMTIPESVELVLQAGAMAKGGEIFLLDMGEPVKINNLALKMISLSGLQVRNQNNPDGDIEIKYTGLRPGEKLYEELLVDGNSSKTPNNMIMMANEKMIGWSMLEPILVELDIAASKNKTQEMYKLIKEIVPEFTGNRLPQTESDKSINSI
jgi:FlaA1/EpsC-like NDP-sugar epimerase